MIPEFKTHRATARAGGDGIGIESRDVERAVWNGRRIDARVGTCVDQTTLSTCEREIELRGLSCYGGVDGAHAGREALNVDVDLLCNRSIQSSKGGIGGSHVALQAAVQAGDARIDGADGATDGLRAGCLRDKDGGTGCGSDAGGAESRYSALKLVHRVLQACNEAEGGIEKGRRRIELRIQAG